MASLIERLQQERKRALARPKTLDVEIPGYQGMLVARYKPLPWEDLQELLDRAGGYEEELKANIDGVIRACDRLMVRQDDGELVSLADQLRDQGEQVEGEIRYDHRLVEILSLNVTPPPEGTVRELVLAVFAGAVSPENSVTHHATAIGGWMRGASLGVDASLGEGWAARNGSSSQLAPTL
jgi:hypothetical protein